MSTLSIFIDESGDYGSNSDFYLITLVFHNQDVDISNPVARLETILADMGFDRGKTLHAGPMIRRESEFKDIDLETRRRLFGRMLMFTRTCDISYKTFCVDKHEHTDEIAIINRLARLVSAFFRDNIEFFSSFDHVIAYYDNGQRIVTQLINTVFGAVFFDVEFRRVRPNDYRLFQSADLLCTLELINTKQSKSLPLTNSEQLFFEGRRRFKKNYMKSVEGLRFENKKITLVK